MKNNFFTIKLNSFTLILLILLAFFYPSTALSKNIKNNDAKSDHEKRSCIQAVDGYAYLSEDMTISETRKAAFLNAKRQAVERARTYITSKTTVEDFVLKKDTVSGTAEGAVTIIEEKDCGIENNTRYHVHIKAEVEYGLKLKQTKAKDHKINAKTSNSGINKSNLLTVKVWTKKKHYKKGESIKIYILGNYDFYARIVDIISTGEIIQLLPNQYRKSSFFKGGKIYQIPGRDDQFNMQVSPPYGKDEIIVYASRAPLGQVSLESIGQGLGIYKGSRKKLSVMTRGISIKSTGSAQMDSAEFIERSWSIATSEEK